MTFGQTHRGDASYREPHDDLGYELRRIAELSGVKVIILDWPPVATSHPSLRNSVWATGRDTPPFEPTVRHLKEGI